ncbi:MAG: hypothetical protein PHZ00_03620 [Candidatus Peribacteraceae bacterium]|nr:hypothetical protein [Candidatus Peribacteraceae bacterium]
MGFRKRNLLMASLSASLLAFPAPCLAGVGAQRLSTFIIGHVIKEGLIAFWGISLVALLYYGAQMVLNSSKDQAYSDTTNSFLNALIGFVIIAAASTFATSFAAYNPSGLGPVIAKVSSTLVYASSGIFILMATLAGLQMVLTQGDEGEFTKWQKVLIGNIIGVMIIFLSSILVNAVMAQDEASIIVEMKGLALFLLTLLGFIGVIALIVAGVMLIISIDESLRDKAKQIVIGTLITLAFVLASYTLIITFL